MYLVFVFLFCFATTDAFSKPIDRERGLYDSNKSAVEQKKVKKFRGYYESAPQMAKKSEDTQAVERTQKIVENCPLTDCDFLESEEVE